MKRRITAIAGAAAAVAIAAGIGGAAFAQQKPPPLGTAPAPQAAPPAPAPRPAPPAPPQAAAPSGKPAPLGAAPPEQALPAPTRPAPVAPPPQIAQPPGAPPVKGGPPSQATPPPVVAIPPAVTPPPAAAPPPAGEPPAVARLRALLPPGASLTYRNAETIDPAGDPAGGVRLSGVTIQPDADSLASIEELTLLGLGEDGVAEATAREVTVQSRGVTRLTAARVRLGGIGVQRPAPGVRFLPDMIRADAVAIESLRVTDETTVLLDRLSIEQYGTGRPTRIAVSGLDVGLPIRAQVDRVRLGRLALSGLDVATLFRALVEKTSPPRQIAGRQALEIDAIAVSATGRPVTSVATVRAEAQSDAQGSGGGTLAIRGVRIEASPGIEAWLRRFAYDALVLELTAESRYDAPSGRVDLTSLALSGQDIGALGLSLVLDGVTQQAIEASDLSGMRLISAGLRYADRSLYARFMRNHAQEMRAPEQQLREQYAAMAGGMLTAPGNAGLDQIREAVQRFIRGQASEIALIARPPQPIPFRQFQGAPPGGAGEIQRLLGLSAVAR